MYRIFGAPGCLPTSSRSISPQPYVESSDLSAVIPSLILNITLTESDRGAYPISVARFLVPVSSMSTDDFTDIVSKLHMESDTFGWLQSDFL